MRRTVFYGCKPALSLLGIVSLSLLCTHFAQGQDTQLEEITSFANGQRFYLDKGSFIPIGNGKLQYKVVGNNSPSSQDERISVNQIDCGTGRMQAPLNEWSEDRQGNASSHFPGPTSPITVSNRTRLHGLLKDACHENLPEVQGNW